MLVYFKIFINSMEILQDILKKKNYLKKNSKKITYPWQEAVLNIIKLCEINKTDSGLVWSLAKRKGHNIIFQLLSQIKQNEIKGNILKHLKYLLKN